MKSDTQGVYVYGTTTKEELTIQTEVEGGQEVLVESPKVTLERGQGNEVGVGGKIEGIVDANAKFSTHINGAVEFRPDPTVTTTAGAKIISTTKYEVIVYKNTSGPKFVTWPS